MNSVTILGIANIKVASLNGKDCLRGEIALNKGKLALIGEGKVATQCKDKEAGLMLISGELISLNDNINLLVKKIAFFEKRGKNEFADLDGLEGSCESDYLSYL